MRSQTARRTTIRRLVVGAVAVLAGCALTVAATTAAAGAASTPSGGPRIDMRVLLLADDGSDPNIQAWEDDLTREGVPFDLVTGATTLTAATFADGDHAHYEGVVVAGADGTDPAGVPSQFSAAEFTLLHAFEQKFAIRQLDVDAYPGPPLGLNFPASTGTLDGQTATLTAAGLAQFPSLRGPVPFEDLDPAVSETFGASATPCDGVAVATCNAKSFTTLVQGPGGASLLGVAQTKDGREEMVCTFTANASQLHNGLLRHGLLSWVTRGIYLGMDRSYLTVDVDDVFLPDDKWDPATKTTPEDAAPGQQDLRMTPADVGALVAWQKAAGMKLDMLFNGGGVADAKESGGGVDPLSDAFLANKSQLPWIDHTYSHLNLDAPVTQAQIESEIAQNDRFAAANALPGYDPAELVSGEHSGIGTSNPFTAANPAMAPALNAEGVTSVGADNSREVGQRAVGGALTLPRYPMNVFYNASTWADELDEYDWLYLAKGAAPAGRGNCTDSATTTCFQTPVTQAQLVDREAAAVLRHMMGNDPRPHYAHQTNLMTQSTAPQVGSRGDGILYAVLGEALARYRADYTTPFLQPTQTALTQELRRQIGWAAAVAAGRVSGTIQDGTVTITASAPVSVPLTGTTVGDVYGGQRSGWTDLAAGQTVAVGANAPPPPPPPPVAPANTVAPAISGTARIGQTLTAGTGRWTGTAPIAYSYAWQRSSDNGANWSAIGGAGAQSFSLPASDQGHRIRVRVTASNGGGSVQAVSAAVGPVSGGGLLGVLLGLL